MTVLTILTILPYPTALFTAITDIINHPVQLFLPLLLTISTIPYSCIYIYCWQYWLHHTAVFKYFTGNINYTVQLYLPLLLTISTIYHIVQLYSPILLNMSIIPYSCIQLYYWQYKPSCTAILLMILAIPLSCIHQYNWQYWPSHAAVFTYTTDNIDHSVQQCSPILQKISPAVFTYITEYIDHFVSCIHQHYWQNIPSRTSVSTYITKNINYPIGLYSPILMTILCISYICTH